MLAVGLNQTQLARLVGLKQPSIGRLIAGGTRETGKLLELASALMTSPEYLSGLVDDPMVDSLAAVAQRYRLLTPRLEENPPPDTIAVAEIDIALGMGGAYLDVQAVQESIVHFPESMIRPFTKADPSMLVFARGDGDSMAPTIGDHDIVLIDRSQSSINRQDKIWAIAYGDIGMIKRVRAMPDGSYKIMSDNPVIEPEIAVDGEMFVIGRVVLTIRGM